MSKRKPRKPIAAARRARAGAAGDVAGTLRSILPADVKVIDVPRTARVAVQVDVNDMGVAYTVALDTRTVIQALVDRREDLPEMLPGTHRLTWGFTHTEKGWKQVVTLTVDGTDIVLDDKSEAKKDSDKSLGVAFLVVS